MKPDGHLKLPGGSTVWWETAREGRPPPLKRLTLPQHTCTHTCALICRDPHPRALLIHCSIIPSPFYQKEKERETKEEESKRRGWVQIALLLWLPSCAFQVLWPSFKDKELTSLLLLKIQGEKWKFLAKLQDVKNNKLWWSGSHLVTGATQHCAGTNIWVRNVHEMYATVGAKYPCSTTGFLEFTFFCILLFKGQI